MTTAVPTPQTTQQSGPLMQHILFPELFGVDSVVLSECAEERTVQKLEERLLSIDAALARYQLPLFSLDVLQSLCG